MYGNHILTLRRLVIKVLSQTASSLTCERNWNTFALIYTKQKNRLAYSKLQYLIFCYNNIKLKIHDIEAKNNKVAKKITSIYSTFLSRLVKKKIINFSNGLDFFI